ncbi:protein-L-isoaspartate O-methyltransferase [Arenimonas sp. GDDSR-1]|uniref:protein-L-isoaspartate O-methyltransferase family protein n=1 Tax=Arenimonas sp. GDDSR-1 TaxID=2950125 RepID=UPI0026248147|nr:protein-L-isoaspartate O-methyltransferase [Arenimonas sp. GDDSR-1]
MTMNVESARHAMIEQQVRPWDIVDLQVLAAMSAVPRENFVPPAYRDLAFADTALPIGHGETMFKPVLEGRMLQGLKLQPNDEVLEIGTGSGFITACLASLCRSLVTIDLHADFIAAAKTRLAALDLNNVRYEQADALAFDPGQQFDAIAVTGAVTEVPQSFLDWLRPGGRLFIIRGQSPVQEAVCLTRTAQGFTTESLFETDIPYLTGAQPVDRFSL